MCEARSWYRRSRAGFLEIRDRGALTRDEAGQPEEMARQIAKCDAAMMKLQGSPVSASVK
jgi:hypothetical protein